MKDLILILSSFLLAVFAINLGSTPFEDSMFSFLLFLIILLCGLSISFMAFALSKTNSKRAFVESLKYSFGISSLIMILGYLTFCIEPIIF